MINEQRDTPLLTDVISYIAMHTGSEPSLAEKDEIRKGLDFYKDFEPLEVDVRDEFEDQDGSDGESIVEWAEDCGHCGITEETTRAYEIGEHYYSSDAISDWVSDLISESMRLRDLVLAFLLSALPDLD